MVLDILVIFFGIFIQCWLVNFVHTCFGSRSLEFGSVEVFAVSGASRQHALQK